MLVSFVWPKFFAVKKRWNMVWHRTKFGKNKINGCLKVCIGLYLLCSWSDLWMVLHQFPSWHSASLLWLQQHSDDNNVDKVGPIFYALLVSLMLTSTIVGSFGPDLTAFRVSWVRWHGCLLPVMIRNATSSICTHCGFWTHPLGVWAHPLCVVHTQCPFCVLYVYMYVPTNVCSNTVCVIAFAYLCCSWMGSCI